MIVADPVPAPDVGTAFLEVTQSLVTEQRHLERERDRLGRDAAEDPLTRLANRRAFKARLEREVSDASADAPLALALFDIDHFKAVNDTYGHPAGDDVLRWLGDHLRSHARRSDLVARFGGEEFVAILHGASLAEGTAWAERVRGAIGEDHAPLPTPRVTVSAGVAAWRPGDSGQDLVERADRALYAAKHGGRDRVVAEGNVAAGQPSDEEMTLPLWEFSSIGLATVEGLVVRRANRVLTRLVGKELAELPVASLVHTEQARAFETHVATAGESWSRAIFGFGSRAGELAAGHVTWVRRHGGVTDVVVEPGATERAAVHESLLGLVDDMVGIQRELERALAGKRAAERRAERLEGLLPMCAICSRVCRPGGTDWMPISEYLEISHIAVARALCDSCTEAARGEQPAR
ncbi:hypothetical protein BH23CHL8_BH23CHL8_23660 [soil metagenome]